MTHSVLDAPIRPLRQRLIDNMTCGVSPARPRATISATSGAWRRSSGVHRTRRRQTTCAGRFHADHAIALVLARLALQAREAGELGEAPAVRERLSPASLRRAREFLQANVAGDPSLEEIAAAVGLSSYHFLRAFKASTGRTPFQWLQDFRVELACGLLAATHMPLAQLALEVGFKTQSHFTVVFRRTMGTTPARWRAEMRG